MRTKEEVVKALEESLEGMYEVKTAWPPNLLWVASTEARVAVLEWILEIKDSYIWGD